MKFFKCHVNKFKDDEVFFMGEQFTEIGPDAFSQTSFQIIIVSYRVTKIMDHAFEGVRNCSIYIPPSVEEIGLLSFDGLGSDTIIFCEKDSFVHKKCLELNLLFDNDVEGCLQMAEKFKEKVSMASGEIMSSAHIEAERIKKLANEEAIKIKNDAIAEANQIKEAAEKEAFEIRNCALAEAVSIKRGAHEEAERIKSQAQRFTPSVQQPKPTPKRNTTAGYSMRNLDEYDDELKQLKEQEETKKGWGFFA